MLRKTIIITLLAMFAIAVPAGAQKLSDEKRRQAFTEMRNYKHRMFTKELELQKDQEQEFFDIYDRMDDELMQMGIEMREMERKTLADEKASETELNTVSRALFEQKKKEAETELKYYDELAKVLTPRQLLKLKSTERKIAMTLAKYHGRRGVQKGQRK